MIENPRHTELQKQPYMQELMRTYWSFCRDGMPFQKATVLFHSDNLQLDLLDCNHTKKHEVKLGGNYNGQHRWKRRNNKMRFPEKFCIALGKQLTEFMALRSANGNHGKIVDTYAKAISEREKCFKLALKAYANPMNVHGVIVPYDPDTGSTGTFMTEGTLEFIEKSASPPVEVRRDECPYCV